MFNYVANLVITASVLCVLFGNGVHVHAIFDHIFDHGDLHAFVHSHAEDQSQNHSHAEEFSDENTHQHPTATVNLIGTLTQKTISKVFEDSELFSSSAILTSNIFTKASILLYLDRPPPDPLYQSEHFSSYTLRGPPVG
ncbi:MAG: hypothetical protein R3283_06650 [Balneolaceae bacterium]|nr:hypothetical protein [Balneolaceae bacterium]